MAVVSWAPFEDLPFCYAVVFPRDVGAISRGDVAALLVSAMSEPNCVNSEIIAGE